ncbi:hypothetical protein [Clavibacter tessellarius]|uniref:hypothetical protein n=1 Tax=Clavibacter tessellarius TaxID=31965 RepID=UPI00324CA602
MQQQWIGSSGWLVLALVNAGLAEQKGRSRWTWFLVSLLLGPIATFFIVTWERAPARPVGTPQEGPTNGLLAVGVGLAALAVVSAVVAAVGGQVLGGGIGGDTGLWLLAAALAVVAVVSLVLHVLAHRRWAALQRAGSARSR